MSYWMDFLVDECFDASHCVMRESDWLVHVALRFFKLHIIIFNDTLIIIYLISSPSTCNSIVIMIFFHRFCFSTSFPRKEFSDDDMQNSLKNLGILLISFSMFHIHLHVLRFVFSLILCVVLYLVWFYALFCISLYSCIVLYLKAFIIPILFTSSLQRILFIVFSFFIHQLY